MRPPTPRDAPTMAQRIRHARRAFIDCCTWHRLHADPAATTNVRRVTVTVEDAEGRTWSVEYAADEQPDGRLPLYVEALSEIDTWRDGYYMRSDPAPGREFFTHVIGLPVVRRYTIREDVATPPTVEAAGA